MLAYYVYAVVLVICANLCILYKNYRKYFVDTIEYSVPVDVVIRTTVLI